MWQPGPRGAGWLRSPRWAARRRGTARRSRSRALARASRLDSVPSGMPSRRAASGRGSPSSSQRTTGPRCRAGSRASSSSRMSRSSSGKPSSGGSTWMGELTRSSLALLRAARVRASLAVRHGDAVQPARDLLAAADRGRLPRQHQERRLEGVLGLVRVAQDAAADAQHHRPVPLHQLRERLLRRLVPTRQEPVEQLLVAQRAGHAELVEGPQVPDDFSRRSTAHDDPPRPPIPQGSEYSGRRRRGASIVPARFAERAQLPCSSGFPA